MYFSVWYSCVFVHALLCHTYTHMCLLIMYIYFFYAAHFQIDTQNSALVEHFFIFSTLTIIKNVVSRCIQKRVEILSLVLTVRFLSKDSECNKSKIKN